MNKLLVISILIFSYSYSWSQAPFGTLGTKWTFEGWSNGSGWEPNWEGDCESNQLLYEVTDEIVIDGITCGIITTNKNSESLIVYQKDGVVFFYENSSFYKLYDFNAIEGDTIQSFRPSNAGSHSLKDFFGNQTETYTKPDTIFTVIDSLDLITINGVQLKKWYTSPVYSDTFVPGPVRLYGNIIENIGSMDGILGDHDLLIGEGCYGGFVCYESEQFQLGSYFFTSCDFTSSTNEHQTNELEIYPNPSKDKYNLSIDNSLIESIELYSSSGEKVLRLNENVIDLSAHPNGLYIMVLTDKNKKTIVDKLIKK